ncbi:MAG TPA: XrtA/PEP-CTERM system exopolysaccharide export protein [Steroidobacter sp.]|jgi:polysaccharide export outer membrane protein|nr:XrtA/PEP-CTERM system exopolysaccharide export protein [Steroidobacter sp.]
MSDCTFSSQPHLQARATAPALSRVELRARGARRLIAVLLFLCACTAGLNHAASAQGASAPQVQMPAESSVGADYVIGPGDTLQVFVWRNPELTTTVPVRPDGKVSTPLVEDMVAVGKTPSQLARDIERVLGEFVRSPQVNVIVTQPASAFSQVKVIGQVLRPQSIAYRDGLTVLDAVLAVGGLGPFAAGNRAKVIRTDNGKQREIKVKLSSLVNKGDMRQNIALRPGDVIVVPESRF